MTFNHQATTTIGAIYKVQDGSLSWLDFGLNPPLVPLNEDVYNLPIH